MSEGKFTVDVTALDLTEDALDALEAEINKIVLDEIASVNKLRLTPRIIGRPGQTRGFIYHPTDTLNPGPILVYGTAMQTAGGSGDLARMKLLVKEAEHFLEGAEIIKSELANLNKML